MIRLGRVNLDGQKAAVAIWPAPKTASESGAVWVKGLLTSTGWQVFGKGNVFEFVFEAHAGIIAGF